ncbi:hypothetical protein V2A60_001238 [Cordyceps javanica]|uniref:Uncharacterized protein n=1 Tax=Cordyceps javanica TaxID=43265 RepID=A0A545VEH4_9HYPO|nr:hypothetical protein IF1G_00053 [Cordyceps javanica]TQW11320.1 actin cytoskeleton-regulatory complex protein END3 domain-containing protein [Cordyceps javanica]
MNGMNGMNGPNMGGGVPMPTPAGHQAELNYIYGMVEELSRQLAENRRVTEDIVSGLGRVRNRARTQGLGNDQVIDAAAEEINRQDQNMDALLSVLSESLEKAKHSRDANATLLTQFANALAGMLKQFHEYKARHVADVASWHRSYRAQLDEARRENTRLREQMGEMQAHAASANASLRRFRRSYDEDRARRDSRVRETALRQEVRFWKRLAMPGLEDDDPYWSADDDIVDAAEKERLAHLERRAAHEQHLARRGVDGGGDEGDEDDEGLPPPMIMHAPTPPQYVSSGGVGGGALGGIAMQRGGDDSGLPMPVPMPPPRPLSAASSTGSTGS